MTEQNAHISIKDMELCIRIAASVAWADGILGIEERKALVTITEDLGYEDIGRAQQLFRQTKELSELEVYAALAPEVRLRMLRYVFLIAVSEDGVSKREQDILKKLSAIALPGKIWDKVQPWLATWAQYAHAYHDLFGTMPDD